MSNGDPSLSPLRERQDSPRKAPRQSLLPPLVLTLVFCAALLFLAHHFRPNWFHNAPDNDANGASAIAPARARR